MKIDDNEFFREATLRICSSLDVDTAMERTYDYISQYIPMEGMYIFFVDLKKNMFYPLGWITESGRRKAPVSIEVSPEYMEHYALRWGEKTMKVKILNDMEAEPLRPQIMNVVRDKDISSIEVPLRLEKTVIGGLSLYIKGKHRYTDEHARLLSLLVQPFSIATLNMRRHRELLYSKNCLADDNRYFIKELMNVSGDRIIGDDTGLKYVMQMARMVAHLQSPVLLLGETGVGKEIIANAIHSLSPRKENPYIKVNCGAIPDSLLDSELFGHEKGAFTGAVETKRGRFERANTGTIYLDEIGELPPPAQIRLLRVLQEQKIERVGGMEQVPIDIRIIFATHRNLQEMVQSGDFREDLWFRINVFPILIPPLRDRKEDIPLLVEHFVRKKAAEMNFKEIPVIRPDTIDILQSYDWPGNVRELENVVEREMILNQYQTGKKELTFSVLSFDRQERQGGSTAKEEELIVSLDENNRNYIRRVLKLTGGKIYGKGGVAELLKINPHTLRARMVRLGVPFQKSALIHKGE